ncbi:MAG: helix-turn-helix domain-containing protein [Catenulispora sp.]
MDLTHFAIEHAIATMWDRYDEALSLGDIADSAIIGGPLFSRTFRSMTGTSPGRFLSVIRLFKAKHLLLQTPLSVADVARSVGYTSPGAFASRFTRSVGTSPGRYRFRSRAGRHALTGGRAPGHPNPAGELTGAVLAPPGAAPHRATRTYVGLFTSPVIQGVPVVCDVLDHPGPYRLCGVPPGTWYIRAATVEMGALDRHPWARRPRLLGAADGVTVHPDGRPVEQGIVLRTATVLDPPILLALPELDNFGTPDPRRQVVITLAT